MRRSIGRGLLTLTLATLVPGVTVAGSTTPAVAVVIPGLATSVPHASAIAWEAKQCSSSTACVAVGVAADVNGSPVAVTATSTSHGWTAPVVVPGALGPTADRSGAGRPSPAGFATLACAAPRRCIAGGWQTDAAGHQVAAVMEEVDGAWSGVHSLPGFDAASSSATPWTASQVTAAACASTYCVVVGTATTTGPLAFADRFTTAGWSTVQVVDGLGSPSGLALPTATCSAGGACAIAGWTSGPTSVVVDATTDGTFPAATTFSSVSSTSGSGPPVLTGLACGGASTCVATGTFVDRAVTVQPFEATSLATLWSAPSTLPGFDAANVGATRYNDGGTIASVVCPDDGDCIAVGTGMDRNGTAQVVVASMVGGTWQSAATLTGQEGVAPEGSEPGQLACVDASTCTATFTSYDDLGAARTAVATEVAGVWGPLETLGGAATGAAGSAGAVPASMSCPPIGGCTILVVATAADGAPRLLVAQTEAASPLVATPLDLPDGVVPVPATSQVTCTAQTTCVVAVTPPFPSSAGGGVVEESAGIFGAPTSTVGLASSVTVVGGGRGAPSGVRCTTVSSCTLVLATVDASGKPAVAVAEVDSGRPGSLTVLARGGGVATAIAAGATPTLRCGAPGFCVVAVTGLDRSGLVVAAVAVERRGTWSALAVPTGLTSLGTSTVLGLDCAGATTCTVVVGVTRPTGAVAVGIVRVVPQGPPTLGGVLADPNPRTGPQSVAMAEWRCLAADRCVGAGTWDGGTSASTSFGVVTRAGSATATVLMASTSFSVASTATALSCGATNRCVAAGTYRDVGGRTQAFVVGLVGSTWQPAAPLEGIAALNVGAHGTAGATLDGLACPSAGHCVVVGTVLDRTGRRQAFLDRTGPAGWKVVGLLRGAAPLNPGGQARVLGLACASATLCALLTTAVDRTGVTVELGSAIGAASVALPAVVSTPGTTVVPTSSFAACAPVDGCEVVVASMAVDGSTSVTATALSSVGWGSPTAVAAPSFLPTAVANGAPTIAIAGTSVVASSIVPTLWS